MAQSAAASADVFLTAEWRYLAMFNYPIDPGLLAPFVPEGTELDLFEGEAFASAVGFLFLNTRVLGVPIPFHRDFEEVNLRFYVKRQEGTLVKRGVAFIQELVPKPAIAWTAQLLYGEKYRAARMSHLVWRIRSGDDAATRFECRWRWRGRKSRLFIETKGPPQPLMSGSLDHFIAEHYWGYSSQRFGGTKEYQVSHPSWRIYKTARAELDFDAAAQYGPQFVSTLEAPLRSVFLAEGSNVSIASGRNVPRPRKPMAY